MSYDKKANPFDKVRYSNFGSAEEAVHKLIKDVQKFKVHLPEDFEAQLLMEGHGEAVCFIVNDLTNRELIRRKFTFQIPSILKNRAYRIDDEIDDDPIIQGSTIFDLSAASDLDINRNERALKTSKDVTNYSNKKQLFDMLNNEPQEELPNKGDHLDIPSQDQDDDLKSRNTTKATLSTAPMTIRTDLTSRYQIDKILEDVQESNISPTEWREECKRVENKLMLPISKKGENGSLDDFYERQTQVLSHLQHVDDFTQGQCPILIDQLIETCKKDLKKIKKRELKLNT